MGLCSIDDVSTFLGKDILPDNQQVIQAIAESTAAIQNYCNQKIEYVENDTVLFDGTGTKKMFLPELPVTQIVSVKVNGVLIDPSGYALAENGVLWRFYDVWPVGARNVEITYSHGYPTIPDDLKGVCYRSAARLYQAQLKALHQDFVAGLQTVTVGDWSEAYESGQSSSSGESDKGISAARTLLLSEKEILNKYRYKRIS